MLAAILQSKVGHILMERFLKSVLEQSLHTSMHFYFFFKLYADIIPLISLSFVLAIK